MPFNRKKRKRPKVSPKSREYLKKILKESIQDQGLESDALRIQEYRSWNVIAFCCQEFGLDFYTILVEISPQDIDKIKQLERQLRKPH